MASISMPNLLNALVLQKSFDSSERPSDHPHFDESATFPLDYFSRDYLVLNDTKSAIPIPEEELLYLRVLRSACTGQLERFENISKIKDTATFAEIINKLDESQGASPLHYAALNGHWGLAKYLLESGAKVDMWNRNNKVTPLICAAVEGHLEVVKLLVKYECNVNAGLNEHSSALLWAVRRDHPTVVRYLLDHGASQNSAIAYSETPSHAAVICGSPQILEMLINSQGYCKADLCWGAERNTPLHLSASGEYPNTWEICRLLLVVGGVTVNIANAAGKTPLHLAMASQDVKIVRTLLGHGAIADMQDSEGRTPLFYAIGDEREALKCLKSLCEEGKCNVNHQDNQGYTALHLAAYKEAVMAAELLLLEGADFSLKSAGGGCSALSILCRKIPTTDKLLSKVFDQAVTNSAVPAFTPTRPLTYPALPTLAQDRQNCKVRVNFNYVVASSSSQAAPRAIKNPAFNPRGSQKPLRFSRIHRVTRLSLSGFLKNDDATLRKETAKIKCLVDENQKHLLLHPVVHSFLVLKWEKARSIFLMTSIIKAILVLLTSVYVELPYALGKKPGVHQGVPVSQGYSSPFLKSSNESINVTTVLPVESGFEGDIPPWYVFMYAVIVTMATLSCVLELMQILRSPKTQLWSLEPWIFVIMVAILVIYMNPYKWGKTRSLFHRAMTALCICLLWIDMWMYMARFPKFGLSIRIFFKVLQNFWLFIVPHVCLFAGFILSFTLLFPQNKEYGNFPNTFSKAIRIMAGDSALPDTAATLLTEEHSFHEMMTHVLVIYIYTAYVLTVGIVLMNMLIGLAVHDIQGIYAEASVNRLTKQTILLNMLEANFNGKFCKSWIRKQFLKKYINLFSSASQSKILTFKPYDSRDTKLDAELKSALLNIGNAASSETATKSEVRRKQTTESESGSQLASIQSNIEAVSRYLAQSQVDQQKLITKVDNLTVRVNMLMEKVNP